MQKYCHLGSRFRVGFSTDAENDYFGRKTDPGYFSLSLVAGNKMETVDDYVVDLHDGVAHMSANLPASTIEGQGLEYLVEVNDATQIEPFRNKIILTVLPAIDTPRGSNAKRRRG